MKNQIKAINVGEPIKYRKYFVEFRFESDNDLPLDKALNVPNMIHCTKFEVFRKRLPTTTCRQLEIILKFLEKSETDNFTPCLILSDRFVHVFRTDFFRIT